MTWLDHHQVDLRRHVDLPGALGDTHDLPLWTRGVADDGDVRSITVWNAPLGGGPPALTAFAATEDDRGDWTPSTYTTGDPVITCTFATVLRVLWLCQARLVVAAPSTGWTPVWPGHELRAVFHDLSGHVNRFAPLGEARAATLWGRVENSVGDAANVLRGLRVPPPRRAKRAPTKKGGTRTWDV